MKRRDFVIKSTLVGLSGIILSNHSQKLPLPINKIIPKALVKGDKIALTAPAGCIWNDYHIRKITKILEEMEYNVVIGETNYLQVGYLAGSDKVRAEELMTFFKDDSIKAILTMRGGWGCSRILDLLDYELIRNNPKIIMGFSDITSLVNAIYLKSGLVSFHGPCGYSSWGEFTTKHVTNSLVSGKPYKMVNSDSSLEEKRTLKPGKASGELVGGNLTVMVSLVGTDYEPNWQNKILFIEETNEEPYRVDRMFWQLKQAGVFNKIAGLVLGSFNKCNPEEPEKSFSLNEVFDQHFSKALFPVYQGASFGHTTDKLTLPIGTRAEMDANQFTITTLEKSVLQ